MTKAINYKKLVVFELTVVIILFIGLAFLSYNSYITNKLISQQTGLITEQKIKIQGLEKKINELKDKELEILSKLNVLEMMGDISMIEKECELSGLKIVKAEYNDGKVNLKIENSNNIAIEGFDLRAYLGDSLIKSESLLGISAYKTEEFVVDSEKPDEVILIPSILIDNEKHICNKKIKSIVSEVVDINGKFNITASLIVSGEATDVNLVVDFIQNGVDISGTASARKKDGSYGEPFDLTGSVNDKIINLEANKVELPAGSVESINADLIIDIILEGVVENNNKIIGEDMGDVVLKVKDYPAPGVTISIEGIFVGERL